MIAPVGAVEAWDKVMETTRPEGTVLQEADEALHSALAADRLLFTIRNPSTANVAWSPDGRLLATGGHGPRNGTTLGGGRDRPG
jgi:hypothetical protein